MRNTYKIAVSAGLVLSLMAPMFAQAASLTADQINSVINLLSSFGVPTSTITTVSAVLNGQVPPRPQDGSGEQHMGSSTNPWGTPPGQFAKQACITLTRDLKIGDDGEDVRQLQDMLSQDPTFGFTASSTGFFGPITARAMMKFQLSNGIASSTTGMVGPLTRGFFERHCGEGLGGDKGKQGEDHGNAPEHPWMGSTTPPMGSTTPGMMGDH